MSDDDLAPRSPCAVVRTEACMAMVNDSLIPAVFDLIPGFVAAAAQAINLCNTRRPKRVAAAATNGARLLLANAFASRGLGLRDACPGDDHAGA